MKVRPSLVTLLLAFALPAAAATRTWTGATSASWNVATNWMDSAMNPAIPASGDDLVFPAGAPNAASSNTLAAGNVYASITFQGSGYAISGNGLQTSNGITCSNVNGGNTIQAAVSFVQSSQTITVAAG